MRAGKTGDRENHYQRFADIMEQAVVPFHYAQAFLTAIWITDRAGDEGDQDYEPGGIYL